VIYVYALELRELCLYSRTQWIILWSRTEWIISMR